VLLAEAAAFLARDHGAPGFLDRFAAAVPGDPSTAGAALERAFAAQARAGHATAALHAGELTVQTTSSGASLTACVLPGQEGSVTASLRLVDADRRPVAGAALRVRTERDDCVVVTNTAGWGRFSGPGLTLSIEVGRAAPGGTGEAEREARRRRPAAAGVIALPRVRRAERFELAAAHEEAAREPDDPARWLVAAGGVDFLCQDRKGGYDLTVLLTGVSAAFADRALGDYAVRFLTWGRNGRKHGWMVPLAPSPLGLAGTLYSTDEDRLDTGSVQVRVAGQLMAALGDQLEEVVSRSVRHAGELRAWDVLRGRLRPGRPRAVLEAALAERENSP
jgi:hypothetical protein